MDMCFNTENIGVNNALRGQVKIHWESVAKACVVICLFVAVRCVEILRRSQLFL